MTDSLLTTGVERCRRRGYEVRQPDDSGQPPGIARPGDDTDPPFGPRRALGLEPLTDADPTTVLSRLWTNQEHDRGTVFLVPDESVGEKVRSILAEPVGVESADSEGRVFYTGPDRIPLAEGGYAAVPRSDDLVWRETDAAVPAEMQSGDDSTAAASNSPAADSGRLELRTDGETLAVLEGVGALDCPSRERFPYCYERDGDKQIRVRDFAGRPVDRYPGVGAMRADGFQPVPAPLVPEHMLDGDVTDWWGVVVE